MPGIESENALTLQLKQKGHESEFPSEHGLTSSENESSTSDPLSRSNMGVSESLAVYGVRLDRALRLQNTTSVTAFPLVQETFWSWHDSESRKNCRYDFGPHVAHWKHQ